MEWIIFAVATGMVVFLVFLVKPRDHSGGYDAYIADSNPSTRNNSISKQW